MTDTVQIGFNKPFSALAYVLNGFKPNDVSRAMIESGNQKQPFYIFNLDEAYRRIQHFKELMPRIQIFYAMKSNDTELMLKLAISQGVGFDCASPGEIYKLVVEYNVNPRSIIYAMATKTPEEMYYAKDIGVKHTTFDSSNELKKIKQYWPEARLLIRIRVDSDCLIRLGDKFGCDFETEAFDLLEEAAHSNLKVVGVAFHVGSVCRSIESFVTALRHARALFDHEAKAGRTMHIVDIGGGFLSDRTDRIDELSKLVNKALDDLFPDPKIQVIAEPGAYICDSAFTLYCNISNARRVKKDGKFINMLYLNDGVFGTLRYEAEWHNISKFKKSTEHETGDLEETILWGPTCSSFDQIMKNFSIQLPRCKPMEWLIVENQGAYSITFSTRFSCIEIPLIRSVISLELWQSVKDNAVFSSSDFVENQEISTPLPMTLPPMPQINMRYKHPHLPTLVILEKLLHYFSSTKCL